MGPSGQGGDEPFDAGKSVQQFQQNINMLEKSKYDLAELFSPPRMTEVTQVFGLKGGWSIDDRVEDPITGRTYDLRNRKDQNEVRRMVRRDKPLVLTVSPPCTLFSIANQGPIDSKELAGAIEMMKFAVEMCDVQRREGRYFTFEQPQGSRARDLGAVKEMTTRQDVWITTMHQCMYGLKTRDAQGQALAYKPTTIVTNHEALAEALSRKCKWGPQACPPGGEDCVHEGCAVPQGDVRGSPQGRSCHPTVHGGVPLFGRGTGRHV